MPFELVSRLNGDSDILVEKYRSTDTGLRVLFAEIDGPLVFGFLCVATEAKDDDGLPHTLEHLILLGSEDYPYKGVLDLLANKCLASGTNAWTDTDHTCYTMTTAGEEGFLNLLPIYLDHILYPTLLEESFITEVHHVNGEGEDGGVVYCEMQGVENYGDRKCHLEMLRNLYPGDCGYKSETGGLMKNLRESTTNEKVKAYHSDFYRPENLCIVIVGTINKDNVFACLKQFETKIIKKNKKRADKKPFTRPWQSPVPPFEQTCKQVVRYPSDDDENGSVYVGWRGPSAVTEYPMMTAITVLLEYLNETAVAPLHQEFVEREDPFCSTIDFSVIESSISCFYLIFNNVAKKKLHSVEQKLFELLTNIVDGKEPIDEQRMKTIIHRKKLHILNQAETSPQYLIVSAAIGDFLYGNTIEDLKQRFEMIPYIDSLNKKELAFWIELLKKYFVTSPYVLIVGEPSPSLLKEMTEEEKLRIQKQRDLLGESGLKEKERLLSAAKNKKTAPLEILQKIKTPSLEKVNFYHLERKNNYLKTNNEPEFTKIPYRFQLDNLKTNFVTFHALLNTSECLENDLRLYLPLWAEIILESAILRETKLVPYEEVVASLTADTVKSNTKIGLGREASTFNCGVFAQMALISLQVEVEKLEKGVVWLRDLLYQTQFTPERIKIVATRMLNDIAQYKREGYFVVKSLLKAITFNPNSNHWSFNMYRQQTFLKKVLKKCENSPDEVINALEQLRERMTSFENLTIHLSLNTKKFKENFVSPLASVFIPEKFQNVIPDFSTQKFIKCFELQTCDNKIPLGVIAGVGSVESSFMIQTVPCINSFTDPDLPALLVLGQYFNQAEGPFFSEVRGKGLAYDFSICPKITEGLFILTLYRSVNVVQAYAEAMKIVQKHLSSDEVWSQSLLDTCKSSLLYELIEREKNPTYVTLESILMYLKGIDSNFKRKILEEVSHVTLEKIKAIAPIYLKPLFNNSVSRCAICCHPSKVDEIVKAFKEYNRQLEVINLEDGANFLSELI
ncbi:uncharacterized protein B4U79_04417 [Dinothrombium tinctorium]|uniref:Uncharacterized protein n=1 Tax=Dinothrombium tinctorium TaxID=1965070 RepID=A0A3S3QL27_9ACAR|nr:uncharacterized protein B4U79_04417 [Dinothrombium tinctorium]